MRVLFPLVATTALLSIDTAFADQASTGQISGRLIDDRGELVADAVVRLHQWHSDRRVWLTSQKTVRTGNGGEYRFEGLPNESFAVAVEAAGFARAFRNIYLEEQQGVKLDFVLRKPAEAAIRVRNEMGQPIAGARLRKMATRGENGEFWIAADSCEVLGIEFQPSDEEGRLPLPPLPEGATLEAVIDHAAMAPAKLKDFSVRAGAAADVMMHPGVVLTFRLGPPELVKAVSEIAIDLRHEPFDHPSTIITGGISVDDEGAVRIAAEAGGYRLLWLKHADYYVAPNYSRDIVEGDFLPIAVGRNDDFVFHLHPKVAARGRVVDAASGKPLSEVWVQGQIPNGPDAVKSDRTVNDWMHAAWAQTDENGEYSIRLAPGRARLSFSKEEFMSDQEYTELTVAGDGSTVISDGRLHPTPTVGGHVVDAEGRPVPGAVVRFRGKQLKHMQPTRTGDKGEFAIQLKYFPKDFQTDERVYTHPLVAFDPIRPLAARVDVKLEDPVSLSDLTLLLGPQPADALLTEFSDEMPPWLKGDLSTPELRARAKPEVRGQQAPELDCIEWLNAPDGVSKLADFRGKYVLLDFWTTWCGPCHGDLPSVELAHQLYKDHGLVVIGVHDNSVPVEAIREHVAKENMEFPIAIDHPDGRTLSAYEKCGVTGYPSYLLLGPDGEILHADSVLPGPSLRTYKLEVIRAHLIGR